MFNKKQILKTLLGITPAVIGLIISLNGLRNVEAKIAQEQRLEAETVMVDKTETIDNDNVSSDKKDDNKVENIEKKCEKEVVIIAKEGLNVRSEANIYSDILTVYPFAKTVKTIAETDEWYKTEEGYIAKVYAIDTDKALEQSKVTTEDIEKYKRIYEDLELELNVSDINGKSGLNINDVYIFTHKYPGLRGIERAVIDAEYEHGINAFVSLAVASLESGYGNSQIAMDKNNLYGMNAQDHNPYELAFSYSSKYESVMDFTRRLSEHYVNRGLTTLDKIQPKYCPTNPGWDELVKGTINNIYNIVSSARE